jgi:adenylate cyclase, class 2
MPTEIEAKFLNADHDALRTKLKEHGAICTHPNRLTRRLILDFPGRPLDKANGWVRLRDELDKVTLAYKQLNGRTLHGMQEVEVTVNDFDKTRALLEAIGLQCFAYQETRRESWELNGVEIDLDEWPWIRPFAEIEGPHETAVWGIVEKLGLKREGALFGSVEIAYQAEYDVTEEEVDNWEQVTFIPIPDWLKVKAKQ